MTASRLALRRSMSALPMFEGHARSSGVAVEWPVVFTRNAFPFWCALAARGLSVLPQCGRPHGLVGPPQPRRGRVHQGRAPAHPPPISSLSCICGPLGGQIVVRMYQVGHIITPCMQRRRVVPCGHSQARWLSRRLGTHRSLCLRAPRGGILPGRRCWRPWAAGW